MYLFEAGANWAAYKKDVNRLASVHNYGYTYLIASLGVDEGAGSYELVAGQSYVFVVDYTYVGSAAQTPGQWTPMYFTYDLEGNPNDPVNGTGGEWGPGYPGAAAGLAPLSILTLLTVALAVFFQ